MTDQTLSGWGRYPRHDSRFISIDSTSQLEQLGNRSMISRGNGRAYGDAAIGSDRTLSMLGLNKIRAFDPDSGILVCESGTLLADLVACLVPRGWFVPVTPGTKFVTVGGMIAADVHGKNHHVDGSFCQHVTEIKLYAPGRGIQTCSRSQDPELFDATCGGMGLTGTIVEATFQLRRIPTAFMRQTTHRTGDLSETLQRLSETQSTYSVAWIDCLASGASLGRSIVMDGEHAFPDELPHAQRDSRYALPDRRSRNVPLDLPGFVLNGHLMKAFNQLYYHSRKPGTSIVGLDSYFYPLDALQNWNRIYGRRGFVQFQFLVPLSGGLETIKRVLSDVAQEKAGSFLAVLKQFGKGGNGYLSFPSEGFTLALDFPVGRKTLPLLLRLQEMVAGSGGRFYLAKDAISSPTHMTKGYPRLDLFRRLRRNRGLDTMFQSFLSRRLEI